MKFVSQEVKYLDIKNRDQKIELAGRTCYNSIDRMTENSSSKFISGILERDHTSVLEHSEITLFYPEKYAVEFGYLFEGSIHEYNDLKFFKIIYLPDLGYLISANIRAWINYYRIWTRVKNYYQTCTKETRDYFKALCNALRTQSEAIAIEFDYYSDSYPVHFEIIDDNYRTRPNYQEVVWSAYLEECRLYTFELTTNRGVTHELVRHRLLAISQQSSRYCNFNGKKYGSELTYCIEDKKLMSNEKDFDFLKKTLQEIEKTYIQLIQQGYQPDNARTILPNALMSKIVLSATKSYWENIFKLRCDNHAHFEIHSLMDQVKKQLNEAVNQLSSPCQICYYLIS